MENNTIPGNSVYRSDIVEIDLLDLMREVFKHWKLMIIAGVICAVIGGIIGAVKEYRNYGDAVTEAKEKYEEELSKYEADKRIREGKISTYEAVFDTIETLAGMKKRKEEYLENSLYLNMDPYNVAENTVLWKVTADQDVKDYYKDGDIDPVDEMISSYVLAGTRSINYEEIGKEMKMEPGPIKDLISLYFDRDANQIVLRVYYEDEDGAQKISEMVREQIREVWENTASELPAHKIEMKSPMSRMTSVPDIENARKLQTDAINIYDDKLAVLRTKIDTMKNPYEIEEPEEPDDGILIKSPVKALAKEAVKYGFIGLLIGCFIICCIYGCIYLFSGAIHTASELRDYFGLEILSDLTLKKPTRNELIKRCAYLIEGKSEGMCVLITGTAPDADRAAFTEALKRCTSKIDIREGGNLLTDSSILEKINDKTDVILIEKRNISKRNDVSEEIRCIRDRKGRFIGAVMV